MIHLRTTSSQQFRKPIQQRRLTSHPRPSTLQPFTTDSLNRIRTLIARPRTDLGCLPPHTTTFNRRLPLESAVLIPLVNLPGGPGVVMQVRSSKLRTHAGEMGFPGGKVDKADASLVAAALRETFEELAVPSENVEILGSLRPEYSLGNKSRVWPIVGFIHAHPPPWYENTLTPLPSFPLTNLVPSPDEVAGILPLPLSAITDPSRQSVHYFRAESRKPYLKIRAGDLVDPPHSGIKESLEVWGLSGWFLNRLAWELGWLNEPEAYEPTS